MLEAAQFLGVHPETLRRYLNAGLFPCVIFTGTRGSDEARKGPRGRRIVKADLEAFLSRKHYGKRAKRPEEAPVAE